MIPRSLVAALGLPLLARVAVGTECMTMSQDVRCMYNTDILADLGSYNSLRNQVAFCKMQSFDTVSRSTSNGPSLFTSGLVRIGVGLSKNQFGSDNTQSWLGLPQGAATCGMCLEVTRVQNMPELNDELTDWDYNKNITVPFLAMVFDQCTDPICEYNGYLDFDVYNENQPVANGNPRIMEWRAVDCPTGDEHKMEYLFCVPGSCNVQNPESVARWGDIFNPDWFAINIRNSRLPIICVSLQDPATGDWKALNYTTAVGWTWQGKTFDTDLATAFRIKVTSADGQEVVETIDRGDVFDVASTPGYRSGLLYRGVQQFQPSHF